MGWSKGGKGEWTKGKGKGGQQWSSSSSGGGYPYSGKGQSKGKGREQQNAHYESFMKYMDWYKQEEEKIKKAAEEKSRQANASSKTKGARFGDRTRWEGETTAWYCMQCNGANNHNGPWCKKKTMGATCGYPNLTYVAPEMRPQKLQEWEDHKKKMMEKSKMIYGEELHTKAENFLSANSFEALVEEVEDSDSEMKDAQATSLDGNAKKEMEGNLQMRKVMAESLTKAGHAVPDTLEKEITDMQTKLGVQEGKAKSSASSTLKDLVDTLKQLEEEQEKEKKAIQEKEEGIKKTEVELEERKKKLKERKEKMLAYEEKTIKPLKDKLAAKTKEEYGQAVGSAEQKPEDGTKKSLLENMSTLATAEQVSALTPVEAEKLFVIMGRSMVHFKAKMVDPAKMDKLQLAIDSMETVIKDSAGGVTRPSQSAEETPSKARKVDENA
jgi:hypothetical protein